MSKKKARPTVVSELSGSAVFGGTGSLLAVMWTGRARTKLVAYMQNLLEHYPTTARCWIADGNSVMITASAERIVSSIIKRIEKNFYLTRWDRGNFVTLTIQGEKQ